MVILVKGGGGEKRVEGERGRRHPSVVVCSWGAGWRGRSSPMFRVCGAGGRVAGGCRRVTLLGRGNLRER